jgi:DNA-directed RNA polymerase subunit N
MYFPIRCFTCGSVLADKYEDYAKKVKEGKGPATVLDELGVERYCCRRMFLSHVEVMDKIVKYRKN